MKKQKKVLAIYLDTKLHNEITFLAKSEHRSLSGQVSYMLMKHLAHTMLQGSLTVDGKGGFSIVDNSPTNLTFNNID